MKNYAKKQTHKGKTAYRTPSVFRYKKTVEYGKLKKAKNVNRPHS